MRHRPLLSLAVAAAALPALCGCNDSDANADSLQQAEATLAALNSSPAAPDFVASTHGSVRQSVSGVISSGTDAQKAAAQLLTGQTYVGDAELAASRAAELELASTHLLGQAQMLAGRLYLWRHARAAAAESYDPSEHVSEIDAALREAQTLRTEQLGTQTGLQDTLARLEQAVQNGTADARAKRAAEVELRDAALELSGDERAEMAQRVFDAQRTADAADRDVADLEAQIAMTRPALREAEHTVAGTDRLIELLRTSREALQERESRGQRTAQVDRQQAAGAASELEDLLAELHELRTGELASAYDDATGHYRSALTNLRGASSADSSLGLWLAVAQHANAEFLSSRAGCEARYAEFLESLAAMTPRLPYAGEIQSRAREAGESASVLDSDARDAYGQASSGFNRAARGPQADTMRELADALQAKAEAGDNAESE